MFEMILPLELEIKIYTFLHKLYMKTIIDEINNNLVIIYTDDKMTFYIGDLNKNKYHNLNVF